MVMEKNDGTTQGQIERLRQFASQSDIVGVAVSVIQGENAALAEELANLSRKGVKVVTVDGDVDRGKFRAARTYSIGSDNAVAGRLLGEATRAVLAGRGVQRGGYVQFVGFTANDNGRSRMDGFRDAIGPAYTEVDRMGDQTDLSKARDNVRTDRGCSSGNRSNWSSPSSFSGSPSFGRGWPSTAFPVPRSAPSRGSA